MVWPWPRSRKCWWCWASRHLWAPRRRGCWCEGAMNREHKEGENQTGEVAPQVPWLEWAASGVGFLLLLGVFGVIGWQAFNGAAMSPVITVEVENVAPVEGGHRVLFRARNSAGA